MLFPSNRPGPSVGWNSLRGTLRRLAGLKPEKASTGYLRQHDRGFALLIVVIVLIVLSLVLGSVIATTHLYIDETGARLSALKLRAATDGAIATIVPDLARASHSTSSGATRTIVIGGFAVAVVIRPEASKLDINYASSDSLARLLHASGLKKEKAAGIARKIIEWRSGATSIDVPVAEGVPVPTPQRPFETLSDLALVSRVGSDLEACLASDITIYTHSGDVDLNDASERLREALEDPQKPEMASNRVSIVGGAAGLPDLYEITTSAKDDVRSIVFRRQLVVRRTGDPRNPVWVLADTAPDPKHENEEAACGRLAANDK